MAAPKSNIAIKSSDQSISGELSSKPEKPLSKLAQKMAATRVAWVEPIPVGRDGDMEIRGSESIPKDGLTLPMMKEDATSGLFFHSVDSTRPPPKITHAPSPFFSILTSTLSADSTPSGTNSIADLHSPLDCDSAEFEERMRKAFGPGVDSPDDAVLRARQGRVGMVEAGLKPRSAAQGRS